MAEEKQDEASKTEEATPRRLEDARKKGQIPATREVNHFFMLLGLTFILVVLGPYLMQQAGDILRPYITQPDMVEITPFMVEDLMRELLINVAALIALPFLLLIICAFTPSFIQNKWVFTTEQMKPKLEKISPIRGIVRLFGMKGIVEFIKNVLKLTLIGTACILTVLPFTSQFPMLQSYSIATSLDFARDIAMRMLLITLIILFMIAIVDFLYQRFALLKQLRMTKQEVKDEYKQQEGDPHIKAKVKQLRRERARKRMMANVPKADVIITNPTHYAIALEYDPDSMKAPKLTAKGVDAVAARIRESAEKHKVPIVRNPPLARVLYDTTEVDEEVPYEHYQAVAKVIGYVYRLKGKTPKKGSDKDANPFKDMKVQKRH